MTSQKKEETKIQKDFLQGPSRIELQVKHNKTSIQYEFGEFSLSEKENDYLETHRTPYDSFVGVKVGP